jgi:xylulokinase
MEKLLMGIDVGTSSCKVALFDSAGKVVSQSTKEYPVYYPAPGHAEQNPLEWWQAICHAVKDVLQAAPVDTRQIAGIGVDGQSWSAIPVDRQGNVLSNTPIWMDTRAEDICKRITEKIGFERIFSVSGNPFEPTYSTPKIIWFKENMPDVYNNTHKFLQSNSYIVYKLTDVMSQDVSQGYGLHFFDIESKKWDEELCDEMRISLEKFPEIFSCHQIVGTVTEEAAAQTGLPVGVPVAAGGLDAACGTLGAGVIHTGETQEQGGQAGGMSICLDKATAHPKLILSCHVVPDRWLLQGGTVGGGGALKWFQQEFGPFEKVQEGEVIKSPFQVMDEEATAINPGSEGLIFLPYMAGERSPIWDKYAKGVYYGLDYSKTRAHMIRATLEGCAYALQHNIKTAEEVDAVIDELVAMGGAANSRLWTQIKADVTGKVIKVPSSDTATTLGAAILAGVGTGVYKDFDEAVTRTVKVTRTHEPNREAHLLYQKYYKIYLKIYEQLKDTFVESEMIK